MNKKVMIVLQLLVAVGSLMLAVDKAVTVFLEKET